jgi:hypothetical protein
MGESDKKPSPPGGGYYKKKWNNNTVQKIANYIGQEYKCGGTSRTEVMTQGEVIIPLPTRPVETRTTSTDVVVTTTPLDALNMSDYQSAKKTVDYQILNQKENRQKLFSLVWQQCTEPMHVKIRAHCDYQAIKQTHLFQHRRREICSSESPRDKDSILQFETR